MDGDLVKLRFSFRYHAALAASAQVVAGWGNPQGAKLGLAAFRLPSRGPYRFR